MMAEKREKNVLQYITGSSENGDMEKVLFHNAESVLVSDMSLKELNLTHRSYNALRRNGIFSAREILSLEYQSFLELKCIGAKSIEEVLDKLKGVICIQEQQNDYVRELQKAVEEIVEDINHRCPDMARAVYFSQIQKTVYANPKLVKKKGENVLKNRELMNFIYAEPVTYKIFQRYMQMILSERRMMTTEELQRNLPDGFWDTVAFEKIIQELKTAGRIECIDNKILYHEPTVLEQVMSMTDGKEKQAVILRLRGKTIEDIVKQTGIARSTVHRSMWDILSKIQKSYEDDFKYWYRTYDLKKEEFQYIFQISEESYQYLQLFSNRGGGRLLDMICEQTLSDEQKERAYEILKNDYVFVKGNAVPIQKEPLMKTLLKENYSDCCGTITECYQLYRHLLEEQQLTYLETVRFPTERAFESYIVRRNFILYKGSGKFRYYEIENRNLEQLFEKMHLEDFTGNKQSTKVLFDWYPELMEEYDIRDENELHNLMKKNEGKLSGYHVVMGRMPYFTVEKRMHLPE